MAVRIPRKTIYKMMKENTELKVSLYAVEALAEHLERLVSEVTKRAEKYALHAKRTTILDSDIDLYFKEVV